MAIKQTTEIISWHAPEFRYYQKTHGWYAAAIAIVILVIGFFILQSDIFAAVCLGIVGLLVIFFAAQKPQTVKIELSPKGVKFGNLLFPYKQLKYFWVVFNENHKSINFHSNTYINNTVILELEDQDPDLVRSYLLQFLPEHSETKETPVQNIIHKLKF